MRLTSVFFSVFAINKVRTYILIINCIHLCHMFSFIVLTVIFYGLYLLFIFAYCLFGICVNGDLFGKNKESMNLKVKRFVLAVAR